MGTVLLAWATNRETGLPCWVGNLPSDKNGERCGCICPSCGLSLSAVNAGKVTFRRQPHFRHLAGNQRKQCSIVAARLAALTKWQELGFIDLPSRRMKASVQGLSGKTYENYFDKPAERVGIRHFDYSDRAAAKLTLADGRVLQVTLAGTVNQDPEGLSQAVMTIEVSDELLMSLDGEAIWNGLQLTGDCWMSHWDDSMLSMEAQRLALAEAADNFDFTNDDGAVLESIAPAFYRETLLHSEAKKIIARIGRLFVPSILDKRKASELFLTEIQLEKRFKSTTPDVFCSASDAKNDDPFPFPLAIEITVRHGIDSDRASRLQADHSHCLEIDLSACAGEVSKEGLEKLLIREIGIKRWVVHPRLAATPVLYVHDQWKSPQFEVELKVLSLEDLAARYKAAVVAYVVDSSQDGNSVMYGTPTSAQRSITIIGRHLRDHGYPKALDPDVIRHHGLLARLLSIEKDSGVGYNLKSGYQVLNAIWQSTSNNKKFLTLYFIAAKVFEPQMNPSQQETYNKWKVELKRNLDAGDLDYQVDTQYDDLVRLLFPEMAKGLRHPARFGRDNGQDFQNEQVAEVRREVPVSNQFANSESFPTITAEARLRNQKETDANWDKEYRKEWDARRVAMNRSPISWGKAKERFLELRGGGIGVDETMTVLALKFGWDTEEKRLLKIYLIYLLE
jgi:hypothetical protein